VEGLQLVSIAVAIKGEHVELISGTVDERKN